MNLNTIIFQNRSDIFHATANSEDTTMEMKNE